MGKNITSVTILGEEYKISCPPEERDQVKVAAAFLNNKLKEMKNVSSLEENKITILTALRITNDFLKIKDSKQVAKEELELNKNLTLVVDKLTKKVRQKKESLSKL